MFSYETVLEALTDLSTRGYNLNFRPGTEGTVQCDAPLLSLPPSALHLEEQYRFEGNTDPGDEMLVLALHAPDKQAKGTLCMAFGPYAAPEFFQLLAGLRTEAATQGPQKRYPSLQPLSREHHHALLLCWKIRRGLNLGVSTERIEAYVRWFAESHLFPHFKVEEENLFPLLGSSDPVTLIAETQHRALRAMLEAAPLNAELLQNFQQSLDQHVRHEERVLFPRLQERIAAEHLQEAMAVHEEKPFADRITDPFWQS